MKIKIKCLKVTSNDEVDSFMKSSAIELLREGIKDGTIYYNAKKAGKDGFWITTETGTPCIVYKPFFKIVR